MGLLRLFLAAVVMLGHFGVLEVSITTIAVCCFYIISGFYIQLLLFSPKVKISDFYISRAFRIYPIYWFFTALTFFTVPNAFGQISAHFWLGLIYIISSITLIGHDVLCLMQYQPAEHNFIPLYSLDALKPGNWRGYDITVLGQAWSLSIEIVFYAMAPLLLRLQSRWVCMLIAASLCIKAYIIVSIGVYDTFWVDAFFPSELMFFLSGAMAYRICDKYFLSHSCISPLITKAAGVILLGIVLFIMGWMGTNREFFISHWLVLYCICTATVLIALPFLFTISKYSFVDRWLGNLSYPIYLSHLTVEYIVADILHRRELFLIICSVFLTAIIVYYVIEEPIDRFRHRKFPTHTRK